MLWLVGLLYLTDATASGLPELEIASFAECIQSAVPQLSLEAIRRNYRLRETDLLLPYLAIYAGKRMPGWRLVFQKRAHERWSSRWNRPEEHLAKQLAAEGAPISPARALTLSIRSCVETGLPSDPFCGALVLHNVLRTLGRHSTALEYDGSGRLVADHNPVWFKQSRAYWLDESDAIAQKLMPLIRVDVSGVYGDWYHWAGVLAFTIHEAAVLRVRATADLVAAMNRVLNPLLAGGEEREEIAKLDRDTVSVAWRWIQLSALEPVYGQLTLRSRCSERDNYVRNVD